MNKKISLLLNELWIIVLCGVISAAFGYELMKRELPCPLCLLQRLGMIAMAIGPTMNLIFGFRVFHYALSIAGILFGGSVSLRQILLHICPQFRTFGLPVLGLELYTWAFIVAACSLAATMILLLMYRADESYQAPNRLRPLGKIAIIFLIIIIIANAGSTFWECGWAFCPDNPVTPVY